MSRFLFQLFGVAALVVAFVYHVAPSTGLYDYDAGAVRPDVALGLAKAVAVGLGIGVGLRLRKRYRRAAA